jgi:hypothetical protein
MDQTILAYAIGGIGYTAFIAFLTAHLVKSANARKQRGKTLLIELNSNNQTAKLIHVPTKDAYEGYQVKNGPYVKFEGNRTYIDREFARPVVVYNGDTGLPLKATTGEASEMDGVVMSAALMSKDWEAIQKSHGGIPWIPLAIIAGITIIGVISVSLWGASQFGN